MVKIDDYKLLMLLRQNARISYSELARIFNVSDTAIRKRIKKLEEKGVIKRYTVEIDPKKIGFDIVALIGIDTKPEYFLSVLDKLKRSKKTMSLYSASGDHMILVECWFRNSSELTSFVDWIKGLEGVTRICPAIILEKIK